jgi:hypothetical protein
MEIDLNKSIGKGESPLFTWADFQPSPSNWASYPWAGSPPVKQGRHPWWLGAAVAIDPMNR